MNVELLKSIGINYDAGVRRFVGNAQLYEKFLRQFPEDPHFAQLEKALQAGDTQEAFRCAHSLKGVLGNLSMDEFYQEMVVLVEELRNSKLDRIDQLLPGLKARYLKTVEAVR